MTLLVKHKSNVIKQATRQRGNVDCPFPSTEYHKKLSQIDECIFNSGNLRELGNSKNVYKPIKHGGLKGKQKHENIFISIMNLREEYSHPPSRCFFEKFIFYEEGGTLVFCDFQYYLKRHLY